MGWLSERASPLESGRTPSTNAPRPLAWIDQLIPSMLLYLGLPILMHCYREFVIFYQHCVRQRFDGRAPRRAPARHAASYAALSCHSCSAGSGCPALAPGGLAESQPFASSTPQPHAPHARHKVSHGTRRRICSRSGKGVGSMREGCAPSARRSG